MLTIANHCIVSTVPHSKRWPQRRKCEREIGVLSITIAIIPTRILCQMQAKSSRVENIKKHIQLQKEKVNFIVASLHPLEKVFAAITVVAS